MKYEIGDYCVVQIEKRKYLVELTTVGKLYAGVVADRSRAHRETQQTLTFDLDQIRTNLGDDPQPGNAYGVKVEPWLRSDEILPWGEIHYFRHIKASEHRKLKDALRAVGNEVDRMGLTASLPIEIHVRPKSGKWAGTYSYRGDRTDIATYHAEDVTSDLEYVIWHEDGHRIWFRDLDPEIRGRWIRLYHESVMLSDYDQTDISELGADYLRQRGTIRAYTETLDEEQRVMFGDCVRWMTGWHSLSKQNIDMLMASFPDDVAPLWPDAQIQAMDKELVVSEYAKKSPEEFMAESWSHRYTGLEIPDRIRNAVDRSYESVT